VRNKIETRSVLLKSPLQQHLLISLVNTLPLEQDNPIEVLIREQPKDRTLDQNRYYHWRVTSITKDGWFHKKQWPHDTWHTFLGKHIMPEEITTKDGEVRSKWIEGIDGELQVISTKLLEKKCFADYITLCEVFGAEELGVQFPVNRNDIPQ